MAFNKCKDSIELLYQFMPVMTLPLQWCSITHCNHSCWCNNKEKKLWVYFFLFLFANHCWFCPVKRPVIVPCMSASQCAVLSCETKQLAARRPGTVKKHQSSYDVSHQKLCSRLCQSTCDFFFLPSATPAAWGLRCNVSLVNCFFFYFPPKLFIPATLALTRCLSGWNSSGLKAPSWQQASMHQLGSAVTERRKQKIRY